MATSMTSATRVCIICEEELELNSFRKAKPLCAHVSEVCQTCASLCIRAALDRNDFNDMPCPHPDCIWTLEEPDIKRIADGKTRGRYTYLSKLAEVKNHPNFRWCANPSCDAYTVHQPTKPERNPLIDDPFILKCEKCGSLSCFLHQRPWHKGQSCREYDESQASRNDRKTEKETQKFVQENTKPCPHCGVRVERDNGCQYIMCGYCWGEFCWTCLAETEDAEHEGKCLEADDSDDSMSEDSNNIDDSDN